jgi:DNA mismatch repair protein MutS
MVYCRGMTHTPNTAALPLFQDNDPDLSPTLPSPLKGEESKGSPSPRARGEGRGLPRRSPNGAKTGEGQPTPMMAQYLAIKKQHPDALVFYRMGDFFELFFDDAVTAAPVLDIALTRRGKHDDVDVPMCGVPAHSYESYLAKLITAGFKVALCDQTETPEQAKQRRGAKALVTREVTRIITPGTVTEENLLPARAAHYLAAVHHTRGRVGIAWMDLSTGAFMTEDISPDAVSATLARIAPREILVTEKMYAQPDYAGTLRLYDRAVTVQPDSVFDAGNAELRLKTHYQTETLDSFGTFAVAEVTAAGVLLDYVERTQRASVMHVQPPTKIAPASLLQMDAATRRNLELTETLSGDKRGSLLHTIDHTVTAGGGRLLHTRLSEPLCDVAVIQTRLDQIEYFAGNAPLREHLRDALKSAPDIERAFARLSLNRGSPRDLSILRDGLSAIATLNHTLQSTGTVPDAVAAIITALHQTPDVQTLADTLRDGLVDTPPLSKDDGGFIRTGFNPTLDQYRTLRDDGRRLILNLQHKYATQTGIDTLKITHNNILGYYIEVSAKRAEPLFKDSATFIHRQTMANAVRFTTMELNTLQRDVLQAGAQSLALELSIFDDLTTKILNTRADLTRLATALATLDVACGLAHLATTENYCRPVVDNTDALHITDGRHPVVEAALRRDNTPFIANDADVSPEKRLWLLTGPNMAGKSTFLRQNALIILLAQMGSFVPAASAHIGIVDRLFSRVGASDDLAKGQSTFMVEMVETAAILNQATNRSFVILDEIGRGTATYDGLAIAWAVLEHLHNTMACRGLFATHYHELTSLSTTLDHLHLATMRVTEHNDQIIFMHSVVNGVAAGSYGIHVARLAGLPTSVTNRADQILGTFEKQEQYTPSPFQGEGRGEGHSIPPPAKPATPIMDQKTKDLIDKITSLDLDALSPREALERLYELKSQIK